MVTRPQCAVPRGVSVNASSAWIVREAGGTPTSTSFDMLARFQQKQLQEKEQKLLQLYDQQQQRAHQVAQRGSAGSNGSNGSSHGSGITNPAGKVRQMFDERRQNNGKGIDKSYPLEPLKKQTGGKTSTKPSAASRRTTTTTTTTLSKRSDSGSTRDSYSRESYASSRGSSLYSKESIQRENLSRDTYRHDFNGFESSPDGQLNGFARNGQHYEINIDEVIDNEAMQRNRMLAKFQPDDLGKRRRFSGDAEPEEFPEEAAHDAPDKASAEKPSVARKASLKNANSLAKPTARKPAIPAVANARQSTVMNTTESASLKVKKIPQHLHKKFVVTRPYKKSATKKKPAPVSKKIQQQQREDKAEKREEKLEEEVSEKSERILERSISGDWESLKSTSLICKIIRSHSRVEQSDDLDAAGKVNKIVTEIEGRTSETRRSTDTLSKSPERKSSDPGPSTFTKRPSIFDSDPGKAAPPETIEENAILQNIENEDKGDGLISRMEAKLSSTLRQGIRESSVEHPTDRQEITIADQSIKVERDAARRLSARRASFELKRMMFEQVQSEEKFSSRDSVESALRHFDSIGVDVIDLCERAAGANDKSEEVDHSIVRLCSKDALKKDQAVKGFERHTSAWLIKTQQPRTLKELASAKRVFSRRLKKSPSKKLLEARDSIELARVSVKPKLQTVCRRKGAAAAERRQPTPDKGDRKQAETDDDEAPVKSQSFPADSSRVARLKSVFSSEQTSKPESPPSSRTSEANPKRANSLSRKNVAPYPSSKSPVDPPGEKSKAAVTKSTSLRALNRAAAGSSGDVAAAANGLSTASRKSSVSAVAGSDSAIDSTNKSPDDEKQAATTRNSPPLSSSSALIGSRGGSHPTSQPKPNVSKSRTSGGPPPPTPAARPSIQAKSLAVHDDSLTTCKICNRNFTSERITLHEQICAKTGQKKRKQFDTLTHRIKGTELEAFVQKPFHGRKQKHASKPAPEPVEPPKSNWRRKHEDFINAIRSAKQMQVHLAAGGKISDLPPPPASDTSDYIQCPHCSRKFNRGAAERHIPKCETIQNKPKPRPAAKAKR